MTTDELDNELVRRKNEYLAVAGAQNIGDLFGLTLRLDSDLKIWCRNDYHYKGAEVCERALLSCEALALMVRSSFKRVAISKLRTLFGMMQDRFRKAEGLWKEGTDYCFKGEAAPDDWPRV